MTDPNVLKAADALEAWAETVTYELDDPRFERAEAAALRRVAKRFGVTIDAIAEELELRGPC